MSGKGLKIFLRTAFDIREGEANRAFLMQLNIFFIISTLLIVKPTANGLFLAKFGVESLPNAFILVALVAAIVASLYSRLLSRMNLQRIISATLLGSVLSLVLLGVLLKLNIQETLVLYLFYIWVAIFALLATSQFWVLANLVFNPREAKRLFGFIGAGAIAGGIFGGYLTSVLSQFMSSENLLFVCALLLSFCIPITRTVWKKNVVEVTPPIRIKKRLRHRIEDHPFYLIKKSKHLTYIASIVAVSVVVAKLVDYQFGGIASALITDPDELTAFFGFWFSTFNVLSLLLQLLLTRKIVGTFGVGSSLFFLPLLIFVAAVTLLIFPELLLVALGLKMADGSLKQSINKAAMELIILPIPMEIKNRTKTFIDVFVDSLATGLSGLILIFIVKGLDLSTQVISVLIIAFVGLWFFLADKVRKEYLRSFKMKIEQTKGEKSPRKGVFDLANESVVGGLKKVLQTGTERQILFVLKKLREVDASRWAESVIPLLNHASGAVRAAALDHLYFYRKENLSHLVMPLIRDVELDVRVRAFEYLLEHTQGNRMAMMEQYLADEDYLLRIAAMISLAIETKDNPVLRDQFHLEQLIRNRLEKLTEIEAPEELRFRKIGLLKAIGYANIPALHASITPFFSDKDEAVVHQALLAAGHTLNPVFIDDLLSGLTEDSTRASAQIALKNYETALVSILQKNIQNANLSIEVIRNIPTLLDSVGTQPAVDFLFELFEYSDFVVRQEALRTLTTLKQKFPYLKFDQKYVVRRIFAEANLYQDTLSALYAQNQLSSQKGDETSNEIVIARKSLINLLERRLDGNLERIFRLLGLKYPTGDMMDIYHGIQSNKSDMRLNALEFLDNLLEPNLKKVLIPIVETAMLESISEEVIRNLNLVIPDEYNCLQMLLQGKDFRVKLATLYLIGQLKDQKYLPLIEDCLNSEQEKVRAFAQSILEKIN